MPTVSSNIWMHFFLTKFNLKTPGREDDDADIHQVVDHQNRRQQHVDIRQQVQHRLRRSGRARLQAADILMRQGEKRSFSPRYER